MSAAPRRLIDLPGMADLETKALMKRDFAEPEARAQYPELDEVSTKLFGLTADQAEATPRPADWDDVETLSLTDQVDRFEDAGWDVRDKNRRPLRTLGHFNQQLWLAIRGVAGELPFVPEDDDGPPKWAASFAADAKKFTRR